MLERARSLTLSVADPQKARRALAEKRARALEAFQACRPGDLACRDYFPVVFTALSKPFSRHENDIFGCFKRFLNGMTCFEALECLYFIFSQKRG